VAKDVPPYCIVQGDRAGLVGINVVGLERGGFAAADIQRIRSLYRVLFLTAGLQSERLAEAQKEFSEFAPARALIEFIQHSQRGVVMPRRGASESES
jgi:UDP-N-acetylglucosamine acyltransferase